MKTQYLCHRCRDKTSNIHALSDSCINPLNSHGATLHLLLQPTQIPTPERFRTNFIQTVSIIYGEYLYSIFFLSQIMTYKSEKLVNPNSTRFDFSRQNLTSASRGQGGDAVIPKRLVSKGLVVYFRPICFESSSKLSSLANWNLHLKSLYQISPFFAAFGHRLYIK